jgi:DDE domain
VSVPVRRSRSTESFRHYCIISDELYAKISDALYVKVAGQWAYLYRAIDKNGETIDFMLRRAVAKLAGGTSMGFLECKKEGLWAEMKDSYSAAQSGSISSRNTPRGKYVAPRA